MEQPFVKNPEISVGDYIKEHAAKLGENIVVRKFERMVIGDTHG
jgi:elongation factor Ts